MAQTNWTKHEWNLSLPGNPRYQPKQLQKIFGYDKLYQPAIEVEFAALETLLEMGIIPAKHAQLLTQKVKQKLLDRIPTTRVDVLEQTVTQHDIRALVQCIQQEIHSKMGRWVHVPLTSYDVISTAQALQFKRAHIEVVAPMLNDLIMQFAEKATEYADTVQIGRTHGQHAVPITVGFWLATILQRLMTVQASLQKAADCLVGKISGPVGAYNAQSVLGFSQDDFERKVLQRLGLNASSISTQITPPEPLQNYLYHCVQLSGIFAQFGRDCRHLMRSEIGEIRESFATGQVGSSTMAHKRNPISFENLEGMYIKNQAEFTKVMGTVISEHQRDLTGSSVMRDFPIIIVNLVQQMNTLLREKDGCSFMSRIEVDRKACLDNVLLAGHAIMAEPLYLAMQMAGYSGDAHDFVSRKVVPLCGEDIHKDLIAIAYDVADDAQTEALEAISFEVKKAISLPRKYTGDAAKKVREIVAIAKG